MEQLDRMIRTNRELNNWLQAEENIVIYGVGDYGKRIIDYLFWMKKSQKIKGIIVTEREKEKEYRGIEIQAAADFLEEHNDCLVLIAVSGRYIEEITQMALKYNRHYCCMTATLYRIMGERMSDMRSLISYQGIDFICVGFAKCGTTSLYDALKRIESVYLSDQKENHFFMWCDNIDDPEKLLIDNFFDNIRDGQKVGIVDPTYRVAAKTYDTFGANVKIIFLVRNPVDAAFSDFKMAARRGLNEIDEIYQNHGGYFSVEMFSQYFEDRGARFQFINMIEEYEKYYGREHLKVVILEELINKPQSVINDILDFIGVSERYEYETVPLKNEGGFVMADLEGYKLARLLRLESEENWNKDLYGSTDRKLNSVIKEEYDKAPKKYGVEITIEQRRNAELYYKNSVRDLETWLNRDLSSIWF